MVTAILLFFVWLVWSGMFDLFHVTLGVISVGIVLLWMGPLTTVKRPSVRILIKEWLCFEWYTVWLMGQVVLANIDVFKLAFHTDLCAVLNPQYITFTTGIKGEVPQFVLAQSITLTPGTITRDIVGNQFTVYAINDAAAGGLPGQMEQKVRAIYREYES